MSTQVGTPGTRTFAILDRSVAVVKAVVAREGQLLLGSSHILLLDRVLGPYEGAFALFQISSKDISTLWRIEEELCSLRLETSRTCQLGQRAV